MVALWDKMANSLGSLSLEGGTRVMGEKMLLELQARRSCTHIFPGSIPWPPPGWGWYTGWALWGPVPLAAAYPASHPRAV